MDVRKTISFAYKVIYVENGLIILFEKFRRFNEGQIRIKMVDADLFVELGNNVMILTKSMIEHLIKTNKLFF